jgi:hypothetical protein
MFGHFNHKMDAAAPNGKPYGTADYFYGQDLGKDFHYLLGQVGKMKELFASYPALVSGGVVTAGGAAWQVNISALVALADYAIQVADGDAVWALPPLTKAELITAIISAAAQVNMDIHSGGDLIPTADGATPNYLWIKYAETAPANATRSRAKGSGSYSYEYRPAPTFGCGPTDPAGDLTKVLLMTLTVSAAGAIVFTMQASPAPVIRKRAALITADAQLLSNFRYIVEASPYQSALNLTLPEAAVGDSIELECLSACKINQSNAEHVISWCRSLFTTKGVTGLIRLFPRDRVKLTYRGAGFSLLIPALKIADPATLPTGTGYGSSWSPDGRYLAIAHDTSPYVTIYDWVTGSPVKVANPATLPTGIGRGASWSPDGRYLAIAHDTTPYSTIYDFRLAATKAWMIDIISNKFRRLDPGNILAFRFK